MNTALRLIVLQDGKEVFSHEAWEPIVIGRQTGHDPKPLIMHCIREQKCRVVLAGRDSSVLSREHLLIEAQRIRVTNESKRHGITLPNRVTLTGGESRAELADFDFDCELGGPCRTIGHRGAPWRAPEFAPATTHGFDRSLRLPFTAVPGVGGKDEAEFWTAFSN